MPFNYSIVQYETSNMKLMLKLQLRNYIEQEYITTFPKQRQLDCLAVFSRAGKKQNKLTKHQKAYKHNL